MVASYRRRRPHEQALEQIGSFDPMPNERNELLVAINFDRLKYWFGQGAKPSLGVSCLLGLAGYTNVHPHTYMKAWRARAAALQKSEGQEKDAEEVKEAESAS